MYIGNLLNNSEFNFNAPCRVIRYIGPNDEAQTVFDSTESGDFPFDLAFKTISAINMGSDGVVEIEYVDMYGDIEE